MCRCVCVCVYMHACSVCVCVCVHACMSLHLVCVFAHLVSFTCELWWNGLHTALVICVPECWERSAHWSCPFFGLAVQAGISCLCKSKFNDWEAETSACLSLAIRVDWLSKAEEQEESRLHSHSCSESHTVLICGVKWISEPADLLNNVLALWYILGCCWVCLGFFWWLFCMWMVVWCQKIWFVPVCECCNIPENVLCLIIWKGHGVRFCCGLP